MNIETKIRTAIIDDREDNLNVLKDFLSFLPNIDFVGGASRYPKSKKLLLDEKPDLVFLDIEMPGRNGFELLHEVREQGCTDLSVVFYTAYDQYMMQALRESAFDYLLKPFTMDELKAVVDRYVKEQEKKKTQKQLAVVNTPKGMPEMIALPTSTGIHFVDKNSIVMFQCEKDGPKEKPNWVVLENGQQRNKLRQGVTARDILSIVGTECFVLINQSTIVNLGFLATIEFKTRNCLLVPPYDWLELSVSRSQLSELRSRFDVF
ncbi:LytTR family DNA-binding domain-containing protein [Mangrovibacterium marinum]|uniref:LytTR family two component transcriptional regulator n=1 Tax=Mangrovibacterium marinum TaxID=1639118 RepID=A0A2T5C6S7_9BACT|nr:response regulator [Mangrovibacterium marinum]PTN10640.1 LytTR family two component transcriptional regulator [Mangrovibacterium marinum]